MRAPNARIDRAHALLWLVTCTACTAAVDDDNPFATVGMSGGTMNGSGNGPGNGSGSNSADASGDDESGPAATDSADEGSTGPEPGTTSEGATDDCDPPCDPLTAVCEAGQCVPPGSPLPGEVVITELMPNPVLVTDDDGEWIELVNVSAGPVDLEGCVLYDDASDEDVVNTGAPLVVPPGGTVVFAKVADMVLNGGVSGVAYAFGTSYTLANLGDEVRLECGGAVVDEVVYLETWPFAEGVALQLSAATLDATANDAPGSWCVATTAYGAGDLGTPGQPNDGC